METSRYRVYPDQIKEHLPRKAASTGQSKPKKEASGATGSGTKRARLPYPSLSKPRIPFQDQDSRHGAARFGV